MTEILAFTAARHQTIKIRTEIAPLEFCIEWFSELSEQQKTAILNREAGYRNICNRGLSQALNLSESSIGHWGAEFERMPAKYRKQLAQVLLHKQMCQLALAEVSGGCMVHFELDITGRMAS